MAYGALYPWTYHEEWCTCDFGRCVSVESLGAGNPGARADYQACVDACDRVLNNEALYETEMTMAEGVNMYNSVFYRGNSTESIFELNFDREGKMNGATANLYGNTSKGKGSAF